MFLVALLLISSSHVSGLRDSPKAIDGAFKGGINPDAEVRQVKNSPMNPIDGTSRARTLRNSSGTIESRPAYHGWQLKAVAANVIVMVILMLVVLGSSSTVGLAMEGNTPSVRDLMEVHGLHGVTEKLPEFWHDPISLKDFREAALRKAMPRLALALGFWFIGLYSNNVSQAWLQKHMNGYYEARWVPKPSDRESVVLWDLGFRLLPAVPNTAIVDIFAAGLPAIVFIRFMVLPGPLSMRWTILNRSLMIWGLLWALRAIMVVVTVLPNPDKTCKPKVSFPENIFLEALTNMPFVFWRSELTCQDVMFSGHTVALTLATIILVRYFAWSPWLPPSSSSRFLPGAFMYKTIAIATMLIGYYVIVASKLHYTADVLVASLLTVLIFQAYHSAVRVAYLPHSQSSVLWSCSIYPFLRWFEQDAADVAYLKLSLLRSPQEEETLAAKMIGTKAALNGSSNSNLGY